MTTYKQITNLEIKNITLLSDWLDIIFKGWGSNPHKSAYQKKRWGDRKRILRTQWGGKNIPEDHICFDNGTPVCEEKTSNTMTTIFQKGDSHNYPNEEDLIRLGVFFHLGFSKTLPLVVKFQFEKYMEEKIKLINNRYEYPQIQNYIPMAEEESQKFEIGNSLPDRRPDPLLTSDKLFKLFVQYMPKNTKAWVANHRELYSLAHSILNGNKHLYDFPQKPWDEGVDVFYSKLKCHSMKGVYWELRFNCDRLEITLASKQDEETLTILLFEAQELKWLDRFGDLYMGLFRLQMEYKQLSSADVYIDYAEDQGYLVKLKDIIDNRKLSTKVEENRENQIKDSVNQLKNEMRKDLNLIHKLIRPETRGFYGLVDLPEDQANYIEDLCKRASELTTDLRKGKSNIYIFEIEKIINHIEQFFESNQIPWPDEANNVLSQGKTVEERIQWLEKRIACLNIELTLIDNRIRSIESSKSALEWDLYNEENANVRIGQLNADIQNFTNEIAD